MTIKQTQQLIQDGKSLKLVAETFTEIASIRLKRIRNDVYRNRVFFDEIAGIFQTVNGIADKLDQEGKIDKSAVRTPRNNRTISLVLTSNYRFYGSLNFDLFQAFESSISKYPTDTLVVGKTGANYLNSSSLKPTFPPLSFQKDLPTQIELKSLVALIKNYSRIWVYYSKFKSVMVQMPTITDITKSPSPQKNQEAPINFVFEPEIGKILDFFDTQITTLLLEQTFLESELARIGARLISMDQAQINADKFITTQRKSLANERRSIVNTKTLESIIVQGALKKSKVYG